MLFDTTFQLIIEDVLEHEGGYVNDPRDKGGETKFGISKRWFPEVDIKNLTKQEAIRLYYDHYWKPSRAYELPEELRATYFDMCVNMGQTQAVKILQKAINSKISGIIDIDGKIGPKTIQSSAMLEKGRLQAYRCLYYANLVKKEPSQERFYYGWFKRAIEV